MFIYLCVYSPVYVTVDPFAAL